MIPSIRAVTTTGSPAFAKSEDSRALGFNTYTKRKIVDLPTLFHPTSGVKASTGMAT